MTSKSTILKTIKEKCRDDCCNGDKESWIDCQIPNCVLFPYRFGREPEPSSIKSRPEKNVPKSEEFASINFSKTEKKTIVADTSSQK